MPLIISFLFLFYLLFGIYSYVYRWSYGWSTLVTGDVGWNDCFTNQWHMGVGSFTSRKDYCWLSLWRLHRMVVLIDSKLVWWLRAILTSMLLWEYIVYRINLNCILKIEKGSLKLIKESIVVTMTTIISLITFTRTTMYITTSKWLFLTT